MNWIQFALGPHLRTPRALLRVKTGHRDLAPHDLDWSVGTQLPRATKVSEVELRRCLLTKEIYHQHDHQSNQQQEISPRSTYSDTRIEIDTHRHHDRHHDRHHHHHHHRPEHHRPEHHRPEHLQLIPYSPIDNIEREYRARSQPGYSENISVTETTVNTPVRRPAFKETVHVDETIVDTPTIRPAVKETVRVDEIVEIDHSHRHEHPKADMPYYEEDGRSTTELIEVRESRPSRRGSSAYQDEPTKSVTIPCHHIRIGDILILQGRPCQVIRISTSSATGQHRYLGVDLFTKQLHEESSSIHNPAPSVVVQTMRGPIMKQYRVLDLQDGHVVAMTETGDVKQALPVIDQSSLWERLQQAFDSGRGSVRVLVVNDHGREMAVDMKVLHGSSL
ncbi:Woronin body major protein [Cytospora mali]|uniref:Woronin body major protein n=1 Tax=Cytospora mali TaxID=578113 RepID=A0A194V7G6_CYTMA|nr:Woronin body major protein [Valsa mali var. pyri (nom. inval.)]